MELSREEWKMSTGFGIDLTMEFATKSYYETCKREYGCSPVEDIIEHIVMLITPLMYAKQETKDTPDVHGFTYYELWEMIANRHAEKYFRDPWGAGVSWDRFDKELLIAIQEMYMPYTRWFGLNSNTGIWEYVTSSKTIPERDGSLYCLLQREDDVNRIIELSKANTKN